VHLYCDTESRADACRGQQTGRDRDSEDRLSQVQACPVDVPSPTQMHESRQSIAKVTCCRHNLNLNPTALICPYSGGDLKLDWL
jgi:hypothetical protein